MEITLFGFVNKVDALGDGSLRLYFTSNMDGSGDRVCITTKSPDLIEEINELNVVSNKCFLFSGLPYYEFDDVKMLKLFSIRSV